VVAAGRGSSRYVEAHCDASINDDVPAVPAADQFESFAERVALKYELVADIAGAA
jgi:hypothetical protein